MTRVVVLLARAPSAKGKTRLTAHLAEDAALALRERLLADTLAAAHATGYPVFVSFTPDEAREELRAIAGDSTLFAQRGDDLGARMRHAMLDAQAAGAVAVALIGSDLPTLPGAHIVRAFDLLDRADVVFGPAEDGGFYLVAARAVPPDLFHGIEWSRADVLARATHAAQAAGLVVAEAPGWWDVDTAADVSRWTAEAGLTPPGAARRASSG